MSWNDLQESGWKVFKDPDPDASFRYIVTLNSVVVKVFWTRRGAIRFVNKQAPKPKRTDWWDGEIVWREEQ